MGGVHQNSGFSSAGLQVGGVRQNNGFSSPGLQVGGVRQNSGFSSAILKQSGKFVLKLDSPCSANGCSKFVFFP